MVSGVEEVDATDASLAGGLLVADEERRWFTMTDEDSSVEAETGADVGAELEAVITGNVTSFELADGEGRLLRAGLPLWSLPDGERRMFETGAAESSVGSSVAPLRELYSNERAPCGSLLYSRFASVIISRLEASTSAWFGCGGAFVRLAPLSNAVAQHSPATATARSRGEDACARAPSPEPFRRPKRGEYLEPPPFVRCRLHSRPPAHAQERTELRCPVKQRETLRSDAVAPGSIAFVP